MSSITNTKHISFFQVKEKKFIRVKPVELLKQTEHEIIILKNDIQYVLTSNYNIENYIKGQDFQILEMFAYARDSENFEKLFPLPQANVEFNESLAVDRYDPNINNQDQIFADQEIAALVDEYKSLSDQLKSVKDMASNLMKKQTGIIKTMVTPVNTTNQMQKVPQVNQNTQRKEIKIYSNNQKNLPNNLKSKKRQRNLTKEEKKLQKKLKKFVN